MSLWSAETLEAMLHPARVRLAHRSFLGRPTGVEVAQVVAEPQGPVTEQAWRPALAGLDALLRRAQEARGRLRIELSDHFVRYALVPWRAELVSDAERLAFAQLSMREMYGAAVDGWALSLSDQSAGKAFICAAIDAALLQALRELASAHRLRLSAVVPLLSARIQRHLRKLDQSVFCFASLEPGRMTLAFHSAAGWDALRGRRLSAGIGEELASALRQESAAADIGATGTLYLAGEDLPVLGSPLAGWSVVRLQEPYGVTPQLPGSPTVAARS